MTGDSCLARTVAPRAAAAVDHADTELIGHDGKLGDTGFLCGGIIWSSLLLKPQISIFFPRNPASAQNYEKLFSSLFKNRKLPLFIL